MADSLLGLGLTYSDGLVARVMAALPAHGEMRPALQPWLRVAFGLTAAVFAFGSWRLDLPGFLGADGPAGWALLTVFFLQAAVGATAAGITLVRDAGPSALSAFRRFLHERRSLSGAGVFDRLKGGRARPAVATLTATVMGMVCLGAVWAFLGWFPADLFPSGLRAARASAAVVAMVLLAAAAVQISIMARGPEGQSWRPALRLVEAGGLILAGIACAANWVIFVA